MSSAPQEAGSSAGGPSGVGWRRHPADLARLTAAALVLAAALALAAADPEAVRAASTDLVELFRRLPSVLRTALVGGAQLVGIVAPVAVAGGLALARRWRTLVSVTGAAAAAAGLAALLQGWLDDTVPPIALRAGEADSWVTGAAFPSGAYLAAAAAVATVWGAELARDWRRALGAAVAVLVAVRLVSALAGPLNVVVTLAVGGLVGSALLLAVGAPARRASRTGVQATLADLGLAAQVEELDVGARHSRTFQGSTGDRALFVKVVGRDERDADLMLRAYRGMRVKGLDDERPGWSPHRVVQHEALSGLLAGQAGARVPAVLGVGETGERDGVLALERVDGRRLADLPADAIPDGVLRAVWAQVAALHAHGVAHRWCNAHHVLVTGVDDGAVLVDFRWARLGADGRLRALDLAELLASLALAVGPERAVASAVDVVGADRLGQVLPLLQPLVLSPETRSGLQARPTLLDELTASLRQATGVERYELAELQRIDLRKLLGLVGAVLVTYALLSFASDGDEIGQALGDADWARLPVLLVLSALTYVAGAVSLLGAVGSRRLPLGETTEVMLGQSFLNRFTPANAGGMALRVRWLQRQGVDLTEAAASLGITSSASGIVQVLLVVVFGVWSGSGGGGRTFHLPDVSEVALVLAVVLVVSGGVLATPWGRRLLLGRVAVTARRLLAEVTALVRRPGRLGLLLGGAFLGKLVTLLAFTEACRAFGIGASFAQLGLLYLTASTVASAAPTPGGLGAVEAALVAVLTGIDVDPATALSTVLVFRLATYWLPVLPSWVALQHLRRTERV